MVTRTPNRSPDTAPGLDADLQRLREFIEAGQIEIARAFVRGLAARWPESRDVGHFARVLAPPTTRILPGGRGRSLDLEHGVLRAHAHEYPGCWIAVHGDRLLAADRELRIVLAVIRSDPAAADAVLYFQPEHDEW